MSAMLLGVWVALAQVAPTFWVEREGESLRVTADVTALFDAELTRKLSSGLTTTLRLTLRLREHDGEADRGHVWREVRARWDLWDERLAVVWNDAGGERGASYLAVGELARAFARFQGVAVGDGIPLDETVYALDATLEVNPLSDETIARMRRWLADPTRAGDDPARGLFGSFVQLFENLRPGVAERTLHAAGHPFRGDRLPLVKRAAP